ncbi:Peptidase aspartic, catalytic [Cucumis melo var. makuwa]|uniref:Peptidase aspartic, catalytic n=1 Tax=Cucumis melo var. makuwa TaxID=1194695 RepID=A0A5D3C344_CUCMM|nr:Peptidase aspartic, catalytic [Cucumis melo var. makuwa]
MRIHRTGLTNLVCYIACLSPLHSTLNIIETTSVAYLDRRSYFNWYQSRVQYSIPDGQQLPRTECAGYLAVDPNIIKLINTCKSAKAAWDILEVAFEETSKVKISRLQILTSRFEALQMGEDETIAKFNVRVFNIANESDALGEKIRKSGLALTSVKEEPIEEHRVMQGNDALTESVVMLTKQVAKLKNQFHKHMGNQQIGKGIRCHECEGFRHIQAECATYLKRKKKGLVATFFDEEDYSERDNEDLGMPLISICTMNDEENVQTHDQPESKNLTDDAADRKKTEDQEVILQQQKRIQDLDEENQSFLSSIVTLKEELAETKHQFEELLKFARMLTNGTSKLDDILDQGRRADDKRGLRFAERDTPFRKTVFIREENCKVALTSVKSPNSSDWYFDSGCSRHMTGNVDFFSDLSECKVGSVVFGDEGKGKIIGKGTINHPGLPFLLDVRLVQGLAANLISISQLCDQDYQVKVTLCNLSKVEEVGLWHKRLGHLSGSTISKVSKADAIIDLPPLSFSSLESCSECTVGKQVKSVHKPVNIFSTSHVLELLHIDLMGLMQTESLGRKRYAVVCVDDFSRYTWIKFNLDKSETFKTCQTLFTQLQREKNTGIGRIRTDHGREFENQHFAELCDNEGIFHEFSAPLTPQQNGVVERRNRTL